MAKLPISACIIAKNEERYLEECLKRLKKYEMEIIVADTGSTDRTKEIAEKYADKVLDFKWINDFSAARNFCAENAKNNWILAIDCDEYISDLNSDTLRILMQKFPKHVGAIQIKNIITKPDGTQGFITDTIARFYNRNFYKFCLPIHEQITPIGINERIDSVDAFMMPIELIHHGYNISDEEMAKKQERNLELLYEKVKQDDKDPYIYFQLGQSTFIKGDLNGAIEYYKKGLSLNPLSDMIYTHEMIMSLAKAYMNLGKKEEAIAVMDQYSDKVKTAKFIYLYAGIYMDSQHYYKALLQYIKATMMRDFDTLGDGQFDCYAKIILLLQSMEQFDTAKLYENKFNAAKAERDRVLNDYISA